MGFKSTNLKSIPLVCIAVGMLMGQSETGETSELSPRRYDWRKSYIPQVDKQMMDIVDYVPLEAKIDAETYILGPGDVLGIQIISSEVMGHSLRVLPSGEVLVPSVGAIKVSGKSLANAITKIDNYIKGTAFPNAKVSVTLQDVRRLMVQVSGAVHKPGFIEVTSVSRLLDAIDLAGGVQKYSRPNVIFINRSGKTLEFNPADFLINGVLDQNPNIMEGDVVFVPFDQGYSNQIANLDDYNLNQVLVVGFVQTPGGFRFIPGYTVRDYIALRGGPTESGSFSKARIIRKNGSVVTSALDELVLPGDIIEVPPTLQYRLFGRTSATQIISTFISIYLAYQTYKASS